MHGIRPSVRGQSIDDPATTPGRPAPRRETARAIALAALARPAPATPPRSLYLHIPFCSHKCHYCDFYSIVDTRDRQAAFTDRLIRELAAFAPLATEPLRTIFIGGGTPSLLAVPLWRDLLAALDHHFDLAAITAGAPETEFTVECNPESVTRELTDTLASGGVTRVSMGAQSFHPKTLATLERRHNPEAVAPALETAAASGIARRSIDLIFAVPGQSLAMWEADVETALSLPIDHLSAYNLTYEPNTAMTARLERGAFTPADEDTELAMLELAVAKTRAAGFERYEVSNYASPGAASRHNLAYWRQEPWIACGPSASGHLAGYRWKNTPRLETYLDVDDEGFTAATDIETPDPKRALAERLMTGLRLAEGVPIAEVTHAAEAIDPATAHAVRAVAKRYAACLDARSVAGRDAWVLSEAGLLIADRVAADFIDAVL